MDKTKIDRLAKKNDSEVKRLIGMFDDSKNIPTFLNLFDYVEFAERIDKTIEFIRQSNNSREIVIETWLIIDYSIRHILKYGLEIDRFCDDNFNILPQGFKDCSYLLQDFINKQKEKMPNPSKHIIFLPYEFKMAIFEDKEFFKKFIQYESEYYKNLNVSGVGVITDLRDNKFRNVDEDWLMAVKKLDDYWFEKANKLNKVRNYASHSFDENRIYKELGLNGKKRFDKLKDYCITTLKDLVGLK